MGSLLECNGSGAGDLPTHGPVDECGACGDWVKKLHSSTFFNPQATAAHLTDDAAMTADDQVTRAFYGSGQFTQNR